MNFAIYIIDDKLQDGFSYLYNSNTESSDEEKISFGLSEYLTTKLFFSVDSHNYCYSPLELIDGIRYDYYNGVSRLYYGDYRSDFAWMKVVDRNIKLNRI